MSAYARGQWVVMHSPKARASHAIQDDLLTRSERSDSLGTLIDASAYAARGRVSRR